MKKITVKDSLFGVENKYNLICISESKVLAE